MGKKERKKSEITETRGFGSKIAEDDEKTEVSSLHDMLKSEVEVEDKEENSGTVEQVDAGEEAARRDSEEQEKLPAIEEEAAKIAAGKGKTNWQQKLAAEKRKA